MTIQDPDTRGVANDVPYTSQPFAQTHPRRLAAIAWLHGVTAAPPPHCRVLELACASGGNLLPMAWQLPNSRFVGVDISATSIEAGKQLVRELGLHNVELLRHDIAEPAADLGTFDYIIAHGVFTWVAPETQRRLLEWLRAHLAPNGIAYVSYNALPGWSFRGAVRDLMRFAADPQAAPAEQVAAGRRMLELAALARPPERSPFGGPLVAELQRLAPQPDDYIWHEFLMPDNRPLYFREFLSLVEPYGLQFLAEADYGAEAVVDLPREAITQLPPVEHDWRRREQMLDFLRWQPFRQSLLCRSNVSVARSVDASRLESLFIAGDLTVDAGDSAAISQVPSSSHSASTIHSVSTIHSASSLTFIAPASRVTTNHPLTKCALSLLASTYPRHWSFAELLSECLRSLAGAIAPEHVRRELAESLLRAYATRLIELSPDEPICGGFDESPGGVTVNATPQASLPVRRQALAGKAITNRLHQLVAPDGFQRLVLSLLDGRSLEAIVDALEAHTRQGVSLFDDAGRPVVDAARVRDVLRATLQRTLKQLARLALLEPNS